MSLFVPKANNFQSVGTATETYVEESNILLQKTERYACGYELTRKKIVSLCSMNGINCPVINELGLSTMMLLIIPRSRWDNLIIQVFHGMTPPILKHPVYGTYMTVNIPVIQMTPEQKKRVNELGTHLSGAIWTRLTRIEKWAVCEGIHGMKLNIDNVFTSFQLSVNRNKENTIDQKKKEEVVLVDTESTSDSDHNETTQRKSKRVRIQSQK